MFCLLYANNSIKYLFSSLIDSIINYPIYIFIIISSLVLSILLLKKSKIIKCVLFSMNIFIITLIIVNYNYHLFNANIFAHFINNIYFYFLSSIIFVIINTIMIIKDKQYKINVIYYTVSLVFILYSLFITYYLENNHYLILYNIYAEITLGNFLYLSYYFYLILMLLKKNN